MVNATATRNAVAWTASDAAVRDGGFVGFAETAQTNYQGASIGIASVNTSASPITTMSLSSTGNWPIATITDLIIRASVSDAGITMGADEMHVYSFAVS